MGDDESLQSSNPGTEKKTQYITGYRGFKVVDGLKREPIDELFDRFIGLTNDTPSPESWAFNSYATRTAKTYFGDFRGWLKKQHASGYLYDERLAFVCDTLKYIQTGRRKIAVRNWIDLIEPDPQLRAEKVPSFKDFQVMVDSYGLPLHSTADMIQWWCSHPKGLYDMICTLSIVFGGQGERAVARS